MNNLEGKIAIVTGASRGIGRAIALQLSNDGASVVINYAGSANKANEVVAEITAAGGQAIAIQADVASPLAIKQLFDQAIAHFGRVDILVNNAGVMSLKPVAEVSEDEFDRLFAVNVKGTFFACQQAALRLSDGGRIINFASSTTVMMMPGYGAYVASKGAVEQLTRTLAKELGSRNITVNAISPGPTDTELFSEGKSPEQIERLTRMAALGRLGQPEDIAKVVAWLASDAAGWVTGQNIRANGGIA